jgi:hypothetical protein
LAELEMPRLQLLSANLNRIPCWPARQRRRLWVERVFATVKLHCSLVELLAELPAILVDFVNSCFEIGRLAQRERWRLAVKWVIILNLDYPRMPVDLAVAFEEG